MLRSKHRCLSNVIARAAALSSVFFFAPANATNIQEQLKDPRAADVTVIGHVLEPKKIPVDKGLIGVALHWGFEMNVFAKDLVNPRMLAVADAERSENPIGFYTPHAAPMQMVFYTGDQFPKDYHGDAFVAMRGSWNRKPPSGYEIARIRFANGKPVAFEAFAQGFLRQHGDRWIHQGRLAGLAQTGDGALLVADDANGVIYRIAYTLKGRNGWPVAEPTNSENTNIRVIQRLGPEPLAEKSSGLSIDLLAADKGLQVSSSEFSDNGSLPEIFAATGEDISPPLSWKKGPKGTKSYVVVMEDPDVQDTPPFVHWLIYNIPADVRHLEKGIPAVAELVKPKGVRQGVNDRGNIGYFGPKPPPEDPPHHYHFQVFALNKKLDIPFGVNREELLQAMSGHVLASGRITATYDR